eukprot:359700-Chlamydomonas_euryale.AAC.1
MCSGDGWSSRAEDAVLHGCIPVVVMDRVHAVFESLLDWDLFSVRVAEAEVERLPEILAAIPEDKVKRMQARLRAVAHRFAYTRGKLVRSLVMQDRAEVPSHQLDDDAFGTIMQWLYHRIPATRGSRGASPGASPSAE